MSKNVKDVLSSAANAASAQNGTLWLFCHPEVTLRSPQSFQQCFYLWPKVQSRAMSAALASHLVASHDYHHSELSKKSVQNMQRLQVQISIKDINQKKSCLEACLKAWAATVRQEKNAHAEQSHPWFGNYWKFTGNQTETRTFEPADGDQQ
jgi:hypothetical protein